MKIDGVGEIKAERIAEERKDIKSVKDLDTEDIKYSRYFCIRSWDMRTDVMYTMFIISLVIEGTLLLLLGIKGINIYIQKYVVLDSKDMKGGK